jgi:hypothetical protein
VLFIAPHASRERQIRQAVHRVLGREGSDFPLLTTTVGALRREGLLGAVWTPMDDQHARLSLLELPGAARSDLDVSCALAKPYWWEVRPGGGEGA